MIPSHCPIEHANNFERVTVQVQSPWSLHDNLVMLLAQILQYQLCPCIECIFFGTCVCCRYHAILIDGTSGVAGL
jgi:hypothetical protein